MRPTGSFGVVCHYIELRTRPRGAQYEHNMLEERVLQLSQFTSGAYTNSYITSVYENNAAGLLRVARILASRGYGAYRISSALFPLMDLVPESLYNTPTIRNLLYTAGKVFRDNDIRVSMHPGQFAVISSDSPATRVKCVTELLNHAWVLDNMGYQQDYTNPINIHGGKRDRLKNIVDQYNELPQTVKQRLTFENDESSYNVYDLLSVTEYTGAPIVFDSHHWSFNTGDMSLDDAYSASIITWPDGVRPLQHVSNTEPEFEGGNFIQRRKHSRLIHHVPQIQLDGVQSGAIDLECEAKGKNIAVDILRNRYGFGLFK